MIFKICIFIIAAYLVLVAVNWCTRSLYKVCGYSMFPTLKEGDILYARRITRFHKFEVGAIYGFISPKIPGETLIKRLIRIEPDGKLWFEGDNKKCSSDSRKFGAIEREKVRVKIICRVIHPTAKKLAENALSGENNEGKHDGLTNAAYDAKLEDRYKRAVNRKARRKIEKKRRRAAKQGGSKEWK